MVDYVKKMTVKKSCKYGKYGLFEHLLSLLRGSGLCCLLMLYNEARILNTCNEPT